MNNTLQSKKADAKTFIELMQKGIDSWVEAGKFVVAKIDEDPTFVDFICDEYPQITPEMVMRFDQLGRKKIHPNLLLCDGPGPRRLRKLTYSLQEKYSNQPVELLIKGEKDWETLKVDIRNLTPDQASQVFASDNIRTVAAQRAYIEDRKIREVALPVESNLPYRISRNRLVITEACTFDRRDLAKILVELE